MFMFMLILLVEFIALPVWAAVVINDKFGVHPVICILIFGVLFAVEIVMYINVPPKVTALLIGGFVFCATCYSLMTGKHPDMLWAVFFGLMYGAFAGFPLWACHPKVNIL